jgi:hypothetical protein
MLSKFKKIKGSNLALMGVAVVAILMPFAIHALSTSATHSGLLSATYGGNSDPKLALAGSNMLFATNCTFNSLYEGFAVSKLTVVNDIDGAFDQPAGTVAVSQVTIQYPDKNGMIQARSSTLSGGKATFGNLDFYVPKNGSATVQIYANVNARSEIGESLSGQKFRLGILDSYAPSTFEAVGQFSSFTYTRPNIGNTSAVDFFVVRKSAPTFGAVPALDDSLNPGEDRFFSFTVKPEGSGSISFGRLSFKVMNSTAGTLNSFKFYRGTTPISVNDGSLGIATIHNGDSGADLSPTGSGSIAPHTTGEVIVSFIQEEILDAGLSQTYYLDGTLNGSVSSGDSVLVRLDDGDDNAEVDGILGTATCGAAGNQLCSTGNGDTGLIFDTGSNQGLFATASDFFDKTIPGRSIIWSDNSADAHLYPVSILGTPDAFAQETVATPASYDWTNGNMLGAYALPFWSLRR